MIQARAKARRDTTHTHYIHWSITIVTRVTSLDGRYTGEMDEGKFGPVCNSVLGLLAIHLLLSIRVTKCN